MNNRAYAILTGLFILVLGAAVLLGALWLSGGGENTKPYVIVTRQSVSGLQPQSTVYFRGIAVGKVQDIRFGPDDPREIEIRIAVRSDVPVTQGTYATLQLQGVTGLSQLELDDKGDNAALLTTGSSHPARIPMQASSFERLSDSGAELVASLKTLSGKLNTVLDEKGQAHIRAVLAQTDAATQALVTLERDLDATARRMPALADQARQTLAELQTTGRKLGALGDQAQSLLDDGKGVGRRLNRETLPQLDSTLQSLDRSARQLQQLLVQLRRDPQQLLRGRRSPPPGPGEQQEDVTE